MVQLKSTKNDWTILRSQKLIVVDYDKVDRQIRSDPRNKNLAKRDGKRQQRDKITGQQKEELRRSIERERPDISGSVSSEIFRLTTECPNIRRNQLTTYCRSYT